MSEQDELERLQRQLDAAFASTRPRRGFEDELWARLGSRPPAVARRSLWGIPGLAAAGGVAVVLLAGVTLLTLVLLGGRGGQMGGSSSSPGLAGPAQRQGPAAQDALPFGPLPAPPGAGVIQVMQGGRLSPVPAGAQMTIADGALPQPATSLRVFRYDPASGPPGGAILEPGALPPNLSESPYPSRQPGDAFTEAAGRAAAANPSGRQAEATLTQARLVYVAVVAGGQGYLEPAYLFTGTYRNGGAPLAAQVLVPALAASALR